MKKLIVAVILFIVAFQSCTKHNGEDDDRKTVIKPPAPGTSAVDSVQNGN